MDEISHWMSYEEVESIPQTVRNKINSILNDYHITVTTLQNNITISTNTYENTIENLTKKLQKENQKYLELEMSNLKTRVTENRYSLASRVRTPKYHILLKKKIEVLNRRNQEMIQKERNLNSQVEFLMENYDKDAQEMCKIVGEYLGEISNLKNRLEEGSYEGKERLMREISILKKNENEYQNHIYEKSNEIYSLRNELNACQAKNEVLEQYKTKYNLLHDEFLKVTGSLNEYRLNTQNDTAVIDKIDTLKKIQDVMILQMTRVLNNTKSNGNSNISASDTMDLTDSIVAIQKVLSCVFNLIEMMNKSKEKIETFVSNLIWSSEEQTKKILEQENLIDEFKKTVHNQMNHSAGNEADISDRLSDEANLLRLENETLKRQIEASKQQNEQASDNILKQNKMLIADIENLRDEIDKLSSQNKTTQSYNEKYKQEIEMMTEKIKELQKNKEKYEEKLRKYQNEIENLEDENNYLSRSNNDKEYVEDLENQLERYKNDVKTIQEQFSQYKKLYESFNIEENTKRSKIMRENIEKKDVLINKLFHLVERYRKMKNMVDHIRSRG